MLEAVTVVDLSGVIRIFRALEKFFQQVNSVVQVKVVHIANIYMQLAFELGAQCFPIALEDVTHIVVFFPVVGNVVVDLAAHLVPDAHRVTVFAHRRIHRLPDIPLPARTTLVANDQFHVVFVFHRDRYVAEVIPVSRPLDGAEIALHAISVFVFIDVDRRVMPKVERIRAGGKSPVELIRIQNLHAESLPATGGTAVKETRPSFAETAELLLDVRD